MVEVAVIGAGASGLVASRHLLGNGLRPLIFDTAKGIGGSWAASSQKGKMWKGLTTNLSKHTCRFSEAPWPPGTPTFPDCDQMTHYLESYASEFDPTCFKFQCQVTQIEKVMEEEYQVKWTDLQTNSNHSKTFQGVVIATGFFSREHWPLELEDVDMAKYSDMISHSNEYKTHEDFENETVVVVGSSFSALEISVDVSKSANRVVNILPSIPWVLPRYIPSKNNTILPIDLAFYQRSKDFPQLSEQTVYTTESSKKRHEYLRSISGQRQELSPLGIPKDYEIPPSVAISDYYLDLVLNESIDVVHGRFQGIDESGVKVAPSVAKYGSSEAVRVIPDITKVICCTGYESSLDEFLDKSILETIEYDRSDTFSPQTSAWDTLHPALPNLAFCGMYRGPYMGIMELQGRLAAKALNGKSPPKENLDQALEVSKYVRDHKPRAQFPRFDYVGELDTLTTQALQEQESFPKFNIKKGDLVSPAFYQGGKEEIARACQDELQDEIDRGIDRMPAIVTSALVGTWVFDRRIVHLSNLSSSPIGAKQEHVYGDVRYSRSKALDYILYREDGFYELTSTKTLNVFREYEYVVQDGGILEIYFVEAGKRAHLFLSLKFTEQNDEGYWVATADHLCIKDLYKGNFQVKLDGLSATEIIITYRVKGPAKDYESTTVMKPKL